MKYYKVLHDGMSCHGGSLHWSLPENHGFWVPGKWMPKIKGKLVPCENGYHVCEFGELFHWLEKDIYECEVKGRIVRDDDKSVVREIRLLRKVDGWNDRTARLFACDCAQHVLHIYEKEHPGDPRPLDAISTARAFANGEATEQQLAAAWAAARDAAWDAARAAAWAAARAAARDAAWDAARDAARAAAWAAAWDAERKWQTQKLTEYIGG